MNAKPALSGRELNTAIANAIEPNPGDLDEFAADRVLSGSAQISPLYMWQVVCVYSEGDVPRWSPMPFATSLDECMIAYEVLKQRGWAVGAFSDNFEDGLARCGLRSYKHGDIALGEGSTLAEALARAILEAAESDCR